jgi:arginase
MLATVATRPAKARSACNSALGMLARFDHARCGVVWLDAHADFNTPESTIRGFFAGMKLAVITGHCYRE